MRDTLPATSPFSRSPTPPPPDGEYDTPAVQEIPNAVGTACRVRQGADPSRATWQIAILSEMGSGKWEPLGEHPEGLLNADEEHHLLNVVRHTKVKLMPANRFCENKDL